MAILIVNTSQDVIVVYIGIPFNGLAFAKFVCMSKQGPRFPSSWSHVRGRRGRDRMVVGFTTTGAISAYHH